MEGLSAKRVIGIDLATGGFNDAGPGQVHFLVTRTGLYGSGARGENGQSRFWPESAPLPLEGGARKVETWEMAEILKSSVELRGVTKWYDSDPERRILDGLDLVVNGGERFAIVGPSGCGKSTLLNLLGTLDVPSEGKVIIDGIDTSGLSEEEIAKIRSEKIGFIFQMHHLLPQCTALENVLIPTLALATRPDPRISADRAKELFARVGLADKGNRHPGQLSGGERQRVAVVRALINRPRLLLADEPTGALDEDNAARLIELLVELNRTEDLAMIVVTHDRTVAESVGAIRTLNRGKLESHS